MIATVAPTNRRIALQLNVAMVFEALILNRLLRLPKNRHEEWLRGLLVQGFLSECRARRELQSDDQSAGDVSAQGTTQHAPAIGPNSEPAKEHEPSIKPDPESLQAAGSAVTFATLRKVVG